MEHIFFSANIIQLNEVLNEVEGNLIPLRKDRIAISLREVLSPVNAVRKLT